MIKLIDSYLEYLSTHPDVVISITLWTITMFFVYFILIKYRKEMISGASGSNNQFEMPEQVTYLVQWVFPPIVCYSAFFRADLPSWVWYTMVGILAYAIGGRWIFEWVLAVRAGATKVDHKNENTEVK